jgi:hypothetical protein
MTSGEMLASGYLNVVSVHVSYSIDIEYTSNETSADREQKGPGTHRLTGR